LLDASARVAGSFTRLEWSEQEVVERVNELLAEPAPRPSPRVWGLVAPVLLALVPKCPLCWAAYVSVLGFAGLQDLPYPRFIAPLLFGLTLLNLLGLLRRARRRHAWWPFVCAAIGALLLLPLVLGEASLLWTIPGLLLTFVGVIAGASARRAGSVALHQPA
jgi:protein SCO1/2